MGIFPVEFPTTTADRFESFRLLHYLAFIKGRVFLYGRASRHIGSCCFDFLLTKEHSHRNENGLRIESCS